MGWVKSLDTWHFTDGVRRDPQVALGRDGAGRVRPWSTACGETCAGVIFEAPIDHGPRCDACLSAAQGDQ